MFASFSRLELCIAVGPDKPGYIKTILSGHLPILIDYECMYEDITGSALWRLRAALRHHDRVCEIDFEGTNAWFNEFFKATNCPFPVLESLELRFVNDCYESKLPDTFLRGPDLSELHLRRLELHNVSLTSISGFLLSATALIDLSLTVATLSSPPEMSPLFACLQGMPCLRSLSLTISSHLESLPHWQPSTPEDIVLLPQLTRFHYSGRNEFLDALVAGIAAPSLRNVDIQSGSDIRLPVVHLPRFLNEIEECYLTVHVIVERRHFCLSLLAPSEYFDHRGSRVNLESVWFSPDSLVRMNDAFSTRIAAVEELFVTIDETTAHEWENLKLVSWRRFYGQFRSVKVLRTGGESNWFIARSLLQNYEGPDDLAYLPALEEIDLGKTSLTSESERESQLAAFQPFASVRQQAGCPVKVFFSP
jgi:hypothetical protein